jgi:hypothetical protein
MRAVSHRALLVIHNASGWGEGRGNRAQGPHGRGSGPILLTVWFAA